MLKYSWN